MPIKYKKIKKYYPSYTKHSYSFSIFIYQNMEEQ